MTEPVAIAGLLVARPLVDLVRDEIAPGTGIEPDHVWALLGDVVREFGPRNAALLARRDDLQAQIDAWLAADPKRALDVPAMRQFLAGIGYLVPEGPDFTIETRRVDAEIGEIAGPQLVVPVDNARYALNAANARWGSLYDALYGTDVLPEGPGTGKGSSYNPGRGALVIAEANRILDGIVPLAAGTWQQVTRLAVDGGNLVLALDDGRPTTLGDPDLFAGSAATDGMLTNVLLRHNRLHLDIWIDPSHPIGQQHPAGVRDVLLEAAVSTIMDCEDSVAAVDADDKARVYGNWAGIMKGTLAVAFGKAGSTLQRTLNPDRGYVDRTGQPLVLHGRSLLLVRNVGAHVLTTAVTTADGQPIAETFLDCVITTLAAIHDLRGRGQVRNSRTGSVYIVKPKHHGPDEVQLSVDLFARVERGFGLPVNTLKIGLMDEERRTTVNLKECIRVARERLVFINTGFLDPAAAEIYTHMNAGPIVPKAAIKAEAWIGAYENWNVDIGLAAGLPGRAQIGKGMWAQPDDMQAMLAAKQAHPDAGASCAWVPSPTAATLHALHYHRTDVRARQQQLASRPRARLEDLLTPPLLTGPALPAEAIQQELDNNAQGILGYVVRWVDQGVGCSKVPDIHDVGLMEDRATLRISSQHIANWLHHGLVDRQQVVETMQRMARIVDTQNAGDAAYQPMAPDFERSIAFQAAMDLVFEGRRQPNGYTEHVLAARRRERKARG